MKKITLFTVALFLTFRIFAQAPGDSCFAAVLINGTGILPCCTGTVTISGISFSGDSATCFNTANIRREGWYSFIISGGSQNITVTATSNSVTSDLALQLFSSCGTPIPGACTNNIVGNGSQTESVTTTGLVNGIYYIRVVNVGSAVTMDLLNLCVNITPPNNICTNATPVVCGGTYVGNSNIGIASAPASCTGNGFIGPGVWFVYTGDGNNVVASLCGSSYDTQIYVYSSTGNCTGLSCIAGNDDDSQAVCGLQSQTVFGTSIGINYYIYVSGYAGDTGPYTLNVSCIPNNFNCTVTQVNNSCFGTTAVAQSTGGIPPYSYLWSNGQNSAIATSLTATINNGPFYSVVVTDSVGNTAIGYITVNPPPPSVTFTTSSTNINCNPSNGSITVNATGGVAPLFYTIDTISYQASNVFNGLLPGTYLVAVKDSNNCVTAVQSVTISQDAPPSFTLSTHNVNCNAGSNGSITINASGGTGILQYSRNGGSTFQLSNIFNGLNAGTYYLVVKDSNNCSTLDSIMITQPLAALSASASHTNVSCLGGSSGSVTVTTTGGTSPYYYSWLPYGGTGVTASNLTAGSYTITVTDTNNCSTYTTAILTQPSSHVSVTTNTINTTCGTSVGQITATATGGTLPYHYLWSNGDSTNITQNLSAGNYTVIVSDNNGCTVSSQTNTISITHAAFTVDFLAATTLGAAPFTVSFTNSTPNMSNYYFTWYWGDASSTYSNNANITHTYSFGGYYDVSLIAIDITTGCADTLVKPGYIFVTGAGCTQTTTIAAPTFIQGCIGDTLTLTATTNASSVYTLQWNVNSIPINGANDSTLIVTQTGDYSVTIIQNGCPVTSNDITITMNNGPTQPVITAIGTIVPCLGGNVTLTAIHLTGGSYLWNTNQTTQSITATTQGIYTVTETSGSTGCGSTSLPFILTTSLPVTSLCMVTVDSLSTHNIVVWEKTNVTVAIDSFRIYREVMPNVYSNIASISNDSLSEYHDYGANPNLNSYRYKLVAVDSCGSLSALSNYHNTIYLQCLGNGNFVWNLYQIENGTNPVSYYNIQRDTLSMGNFIDISTNIPANNISYTDTSFASYPFASYRIAVTWNITCTPTRSINTTYSNISHEFPLSVSNLSLSNSVNIYPNPFTSQTTIAFKEIQKNTSLKITDILGKEIKSILVSGTKNIVIEKGNMQPGIYFVQIIDEKKNVINQKIILQ